MSDVTKTFPSIRKVVSIAVYQELRHTSGEVSKLVVTPEGIFERLGKRVTKSQYVDCRVSRDNLHGFLRDNNLQHPANEDVIANCDLYNGYY